MVVGVQEELDVSKKFVVAGIVVAAHSRLLERAVHAFDLSVGPGVIWSGQSLLNAVLLAGVAEGVNASGARLLAGAPGRLDVLAAAFLRAGVSELDAVVGEQVVHPAGQGLDQGAKEVGRNLACRLLVQLGKGKLAGAIDGHEHEELAALGPDLGNVDVKTANGIGLETLPGFLLALCDGQAEDTMALHAAMQAKAGQLGNAGLKGIQAVVERRQGIAAEGETTASCSALSTQERTCLGPVAAAPAVWRLRHFWTAVG